MAKANVTIIEAQMGEGKSNTATADVVDYYWSEIYAVRNPVTNKIYRVKPFHSDEVYIEDTSYVFKIPEYWETYSHARIYCNYHLFGVKYVYCTTEQMLTLLNTGLISNGKLIIDEAYIEGDARRGSSSLTLIMTWFGQQMRKRSIELFLIVQHGRFIDWRFRYIAKRKMLTSYNEKTHMIHLLIQNLVKGTEKATSFWAPQYWKYYDTNEIPQVPEKMIEAAAGWSR